MASSIQLDGVGALLLDQVDRWTRSSAPAPAACHDVWMPTPFHLTSALLAPLQTSTVLISATSISSPVYTSPLNIAAIAPCQNSFGQTYETDLINRRKESTPRASR